MIKTIIPILALTITLTSCADPSAGSGVPTFFNDVITFSAGGGYTAAIKENGELWAWGRNCEGQLGDGTYNAYYEGKSSPVKIGNKWKGVSAGGTSDSSFSSDGYTVATKIDGVLWAWGNNQYGRLGDGTITGRSVPKRVISGW